MKSAVIDTASSLISRLAHMINSYDDLKRPELLFRVTGGLGNQMFQYACAKSLQLKYGVSVKLDIQQCQWHARRGYELDKFSISLPIAGIKDISPFCSESLPANRLMILDGLAKKAQEHNSYRILFRKILKMNMLHPDKHVFHEDHDNINAIHSLNLPENLPAYIDGYWQNAEYFRHFDDVIRQEFSLSVLLSDSVKALHEKICQHHCVISVHIRRGDYLSRKVSNMFKVLPMDYYRSAMDRLSQFYENSVFILFSDDPEWVKKQFAYLPYKYEIVDGNHQGYEDLYLMSQCQHHIIANSTFSWWGAWLGIAPNKQVIAPKQWGFSDRVSKITGGIIPPEWVKI